MTEQEKLYFKEKNPDLEFFDKPTDYINEPFCQIMFSTDYEKDKLNIVCNYLKRMFLDLLKTRGVDCVKKSSIDEILDEINKNIEHSIFSDIDNQMKIIANPSLYLNSDNIKMFSDKVDNDDSAIVDLLSYYYNDICNNIDSIFLEIEWLGDIQEENKISDDKIIKYISFLEYLPQIISYRSKSVQTIRIKDDIVKADTINKFISNEDFIQKLNNIMEHNIAENHYYYHGTQCLEDAYSIMEQGLAMIRENLSSTAYQEMNMDQVLLYSRGLGGEIGEEVIVIIDVPIQDNIELNVVEQMKEGHNIDFVPSGLQGLIEDGKYIIHPKYIVGVIDKKNQTIIYNPGYYDYEKFNQKGL